MKKLNYIIIRLIIHILYPMLHSFQMFILFVLIIYGINANDIKQNTYDVIILGGGVSGLAALNNLIQNGINNILLIEANTKVGGRLKTDIFNGQKINIGAKWIQGSKNNLFFERYIKNNINYTKSDFNNLIIYDNANNITYTNSDIKKTHNNFNKIIYDSPIKYNIKPNKINVKKHLLSYNYDSSTSIIKYLIEKNNIDNEFGLKSNKIPMDNFRPDYLYRDFGDKNLFLLDDIDKIIDNMIYKKEHFLILNTTINKIEYDNNPIIIKTEKNNYMAKYVICTFSLGILKEDNIFYPKLNSIRSFNNFPMNMVNYLTIFAEFDEIKWNREHEFVIFYKNKNEYLIGLNLAHSKYYKKPIIVFLVYDKIIKKIRSNNINQNIDLIYKITGIKPKNIIRNDFDINKYYIGSFSNRNINMNKKNHKKMFSNINNLYFAGEHTHYKYSSSIQGAYYSGLDISNKIIKIIET